MALRPTEVEIVSPCPVDLDETGLRGAGRSWHCGHCSKTVHVLSTMTESEARTFLREHAGEDLCVSYAISPAGEVRFRPEPSASIVPVGALGRRTRRLAAAGLGVALAACAPHDNPEVRAVAHEVIAAPTPSGPTIPAQREPTAPARPLPTDEIVDGMMRRPDVQIEGGIRAAPAEEPCDPPIRVSTKRGKFVSPR
jgi:hypothetical protein